MISFIIPAHNEQQVIARTLDALAAAAGELAAPFELVVVDDGSSDATGSIAIAHQARVVPVDVRHIARVRNLGALAAHGDPLIFVDADTLVPTATLGAALQALAAGAVGGGATVTFDGRVPFWGAVLLPVVRGVLRAANVPAGCFVFCRREAFDAVGGFDERLYAAEEIAFGRALRRRGRLVILREIVVTSGRKLRTHTIWEGLRLAAAVLRRGPSSIRSRDRLSLWYGDRRQDPEDRQNSEF
jgi:cellulose synthase/poly-beta-1,6-N-acetylglucosamine synthase-like glycosyltransferase